LVLEAIALVVARVVTSDTSGGVNSGIQRKNVIDIFDRRAIDTTLVNGVVGEKGPGAGSGHNVGVSASRRESNVEFGQVDIVLEVAIRVTGLKNDSSVVTSSIEPGNDGHGKIEGSWNNSGGVRIVTNILSIELDINRISTGFCGSVGGREVSILTVTNIEGCDVYVEAVGLIEGNRPVLRREGCGRARFDRDVVLVGGHDGETGLFSGDKGIRVNTGSNSDRQTRGISVSEVQGFVGRSTQVAVEVLDVKVVDSDLEGGESSVIDSVIASDGARVCLGGLGVDGEMGSVVGIRAIGDVILPVIGDR